MTYLNCSACHLSIRQVKTMTEALLRRQWSSLLPRDVPAARSARSALDEWLQGTNGETADAARSIVTELVSNAVRFGRPPIQLTVEQHSSFLRIEVVDGGTGAAVRTLFGESGGWALEIVRRLAARYGTLQDRNGVWCELPTPTEKKGTDA